MNTKLLNFLVQNFKEKRLIFQDTGGESEPDAGPEAPVSQAAGPAERAAAADDAADGLDENPLEVVTIPAEEPQFNDNPPEIYEYSGDPNEPALNDLRRKPADGTIGYTYEIWNNTEWVNVIPIWAPAGPAGTPDAAAEQASQDLEAAKEKIVETRATVVQRKSEVTHDALKATIKTSLTGDEQLIEAVADIAFPENFQASIDQHFAEIEEILTTADDLPTAAEIDTKVLEANNKLRAISIETYIENYATPLDQFTPLLALFDKYKTLAKEGTHATAVIDEIRDAIKEDLQKGDPLPEQIPNTIKSDFDEELAKAVVADIIGETPKAFDAAIRYYKLGKYKTVDLNTDAKYAESQRILAVFMEKKGEIEKRGIKIDFFGSTNNVDHRRTTLLAWHQEKAAALQKILDLNAAGRLQVDGDMTTFITDNEALIKQYIEQVATGDKANYMKVVDDNKPLFLTGGTIFDLALRLQRAAEFKRFVQGEPEPAEGGHHTDIFDSTDTGTDTIQLLHQNDDSAEGMKSGIKVGISEDVSPITAEGDEEEGGEEAPTTTEDEEEGEEDAEAADKGPDTEPETPEVKTNEHDHAYAIESDGRLKVTFMDNSEGYYTIKKPDNIILTPKRVEKEEYILFSPKGGELDDWGYFEFNKKNKSFNSLSLDYDNNHYTAELTGETITIKEESAANAAARLTGEAIGLNKAAQAEKDREKKSSLELKAAGRLQKAIELDPDGGHQERFNMGTMPAADEALAAIDDSETTVALRTKLTEAKTEIEELIRKFEGTIGTNTGLEDAVAAEVAQKKAAMDETFEKVKGKLEEAVDETNRGGFGEAQAAYEEAERIITETLDEEMEPDFKEKFLSSESAAAITELRAAVEKHKPLVEAAFANKVEAVQALDAAAPAAE